MPTVAPPLTQDRRGGILDATLRLVIGEGLHNVTTAAVSEMAGIAAGTLFNYFDTKQALLNALYVELIRRRHAAVTADLSDEAPDAFKAFWYAWARWHLDRPAIPNVIQQFEVSSLLTPESIAVREDLDERLRRRFLPEADGMLAEPLQRQVLYALMVGPIHVLAQLREKGEIPITDELLEETYRRARHALEA